LQNKGFRNDLPVLQYRNSRTRVYASRHVDFGEANSAFIAHIQHNFSPRVDNKRMTIGCASVFMRSRLGSRYNPRGILYCTRA
jgi:hypothetical protein